MKKIKSIYGPEPCRSGEYPDCYMVGYGGVTHIAQRAHDLGTYHVVWFDIFSGNAVIASMNSVHVAIIHYEKETA